MGDYKYTKEVYVSVELARKMTAKGFDPYEDGNVYVPTQTNAMAWIRDKFNIHIIVDYTGQIALYSWWLKDMKSGDELPYNGLGVEYENAVDNAIEFVLDNLAE